MTKHQFALACLEITTALREALVPAVNAAGEKYQIDAIGRDRTQMTAIAVMVFSGEVLGSALTARGGSTEREARRMFEQTLDMTFSETERYKARHQASRN